MPRHYLEDSLINAIQNSDNEVVKKLIKVINKKSQSSNANKPDLDATNDDGLTFLHIALARNNAEAFIIMYPYFANNRVLLLSVDKFWRSLLWYAISHNNKEIAEKFLLSVYKNSDAPLLAKDTWLKPDTERISPIHLAAKSSDPTLLSWLFTHLDKEDDITELIDVTDNLGNTPLHFAGKYQRINQVTLLLKHGAKIDTVNKENRSFLTILENNPSLLSPNLLSKNLQKKVLEAQRARVLLNPEDEKLRLAHYKFAGLISMEDYAREKMFIECNIEYDTDNEDSASEKQKNFASYSHITNALSIGIKQQNTVKLNAQIGQDKMTLTRLSHKMTEFLNHSVKYSDHINSCKVLFTMTPWVPPLGGIVLGLLSAMIILPRHISTFSVGLMMFFSHPVSWVIIALVVLPILINLVAFGVFTYLDYKNNCDFKQLISELKELFSKIPPPGNNFSLQFHPENDLIKKIQSQIEVLEKGNLSIQENHDETLKLIQDIDALIKEMEKQGRPITPVELIRETAPKDLKPARTDASEPVKGNIDEVVVTLPRLSNNPSARYAQSKVSSEESNSEEMTLLNKEAYNLI